MINKPKYKEGTVLCPQCSAPFYAGKNKHIVRVTKCNWCGYRYIDPKEAGKRQGIYPVVRNK